MPNNGVRSNGVLDATMGWAAFIEDFKRYVGPDEWHFKGLLYRWLHEEALWFLLVFRMSRLIRARVHVPGIRFVLKAATWAAHRALVLVTGLDISLDARIGPGLYIGHGGPIVIGQDVVIGSFCNISTQSVFGGSGRGETWGSPVIGDKVYAAPGAKVFGAITVGNNAVIGANTVVYSDVPDNAVMAGNPGRIINFKGSGDYVHLWPERTEDGGPVTVDETGSVNEKRASTAF